MHPFNLYYFLLTQEKGNSSYALHKPHDQEELQGIPHHYICTLIVYLYILFNRKWWTSQWHSHKQSQARIHVLVYRSVQNTKS